MHARLPALFDFAIATVSSSRPQSTRKTSPSLMLLEIPNIIACCRTDTPVASIECTFVIKLEQQRCGLVPCQAPCKRRAPQTR
jgi:hypothetical protein